ncbi:MAG: choice-of-anchor J domain-containing protein [Saprospiraceae bacterium]
MKYFTVLLLLFSALCLNGQALGIPDTLLIQTFSVDPSDTMLPFPSGNDLKWVNWDADNGATDCGRTEMVPGNWFWDSDLGNPDNPDLNFAFTSCSWMVDTNVRNENWLITPPVFIPDSATLLSWRSLSLDGPGYVDGYKVLVSTTTNEPFTNAFIDTLFMAAEMVAYSVEGSFNPEDYVYSPGYVHANWYTDMAYFFLAHPSAPSYNGRLEPHSVSLSKYAGNWIYIAFLHDSKNDNILQLDDIAVLNGEISSTFAPAFQQYFLKTNPNPAAESARISWKSDLPGSGRVMLTDLLGNNLVEQQIENLSAGTCTLNIRHLPLGLYPCTLETSTGRQTILLVKQ